MFEWLSAAPALVTALALATVPGLPVAWMLRFRGFTFIAASIAASIAVIAITTVIAPIVGIAWGILPVLGATVVLTVLLIPVRYLTRNAQSTYSTTRSSFLWAAAAVAVAGLLIGQELARAIGAPSNISQTYDGVFHLNAAAHILLNGDASPFHMDLSSPGTSSSYYPTLWHAIVALIAGLSGASIPVATNSLVLIVASWIWPVAILFFARPFFARRPVHLILGAILAANFSAFPYLLVAWGVLYPNLLSTALIPLALGFIYPAVRYRAVASDAPLVSLWLATLGAVGAAALAHPNAVFGIAAFTIPMFIVCANDVRSLHASTTAKVVRWGALAAVIAVYLVLWNLVRTGDNSRNYDQSFMNAFISGISNAQMIDTRAWFLTVLVTGGIAALLITRRHRWLIISYGVALLLFIIAAGLDGSVRDTFTGAWYNDAHRLAALMPIGAIPLAAVAASRLLDYVTVGIQNADADRISPRVRPFLPMIGAIIVFALVLSGARGQNLALQSGWIADLHSTDGESHLLSTDEQTLLERVATETPIDAVIAGDPWTGTGLALAISHREVLYPHLNGSYSEEAKKLALEFDELDAQLACSLLTDLGVTYILDFGRVKYDIGNNSLYAPYLGLNQIRSSSVATEVDREGDAVLYSVDCAAASN